ncbi:MAG: GNAT family N-acetyltransferase [Thermoflexales bacterium]|nr:GNAT family N-acetyltransferase [Thermoflexales bacterium]
MNRLPVLLLYGLDARSHDWEVTSTRALVARVQQALRGQGWLVHALEVRDDLAGALAPYRPGEWVVLNLCEGAPEQAFYYAAAAEHLERTGHIYTGSSAHCLDVTQYKGMTKRLLDAAGVPTPRWREIQGPEQADFDAYPAILKPSAEHCSYGITRESVVVNDAEARAQAAHLAATFGGNILVEAFLDSPEYNVSVWGNGEAHVLGISTMTYDAFSDIHDRLCTFDAKWTPESVAYRRIPAICPAPISAALAAEIEAVAVAAYRACGVRDYGRVDLRLTSEGHPLAYDVNANCDVSDDGGFFHAAEAAGLSYGQMLERILIFALRRHAQDAPAQPVGTVRVVDSVAADREEIGAILTNSGLFHAVDVATVDEMFATTYARPITRDSYRFLTAWEDLPNGQSRRVGFACFGLESLTEDTWDLFWVCALPSARGRGVGGALLGRAVATALAENGRVMVIYTSSTDPYAPARRLYASQGFARTAVIPDYYSDGDDLNIFSRRLRPRPGAQADGATTSVSEG